MKTIQEILEEGDIPSGEFRYDEDVGEIHYAAEERARFFLTEVIDLNKMSLNELIMTFNDICERRMLNLINTIQNKEFPQE